MKSWWSLMLLALALPTAALAAPAHFALSPGEVLTYKVTRSEEHTSELQSH